MNDPQDSSPKRSLWGIPVMWLVVGLPLLSIVAGVGLVVVAVRTGGTDVVRDEVQRVSQIQTTDLAADQAAAQRQLSALLRAEDGSIDVIAVSGDFARQQPLQLTLQHPTAASEDLVLALKPSATGWHAPHALDDSHDWVVQLSAEDGSWRLQGRLPRAQHAARLAPALTPH
jgi:hypothetical protein